MKQKKDYSSIILISIVAFVGIIAIFTLTNQNITKKDLTGQAISFNEGSCEDESVIYFDRNQFNERDYEISYSRDKTNVKIDLGKTELDKENAIRDLAEILNKKINLDSRIIQQEINQVYFELDQQFKESQMTGDYRFLPSCGGNCAHTWGGKCLWSICFTLRYGLKGYKPLPPIDGNDDPTYIEIIFNNNMIN